MIWAVLAIASVIGVLWGTTTFCNLNVGKRDESINVQFMMTIGGQVRQLTDIEALKDELVNNPNGEDIIITLTPEYFGLASWTIVRSNGWYINFVKIHKKEKYIQYFICPMSNIDVALSDFKNVFVDKKAVDTSALSNMRYYKGNLEVFHLENYERFRKFL